MLFVLFCSVDVDVLVVVAVLGAEVPLTNLPKLDLLELLLAPPLPFPPPVVVPSSSLSPLLSLSPPDDDLPPVDSLPSLLDGLDFLSLFSPELPDCNLEGPPLYVTSAATATHFRANRR